MYDVMLDLETTGVNPHVNGIVQIAAWKFDYLSGEVNPEPLNIPIQLASGRMWDFDTIQWWRESKERMDHLNWCRANGVPAREGFQMLFDWIGHARQGYRLWAKPITFEFPFLQSHFSQLDIPIPFHYRYSKDINTWICALKGDPGATTYDIDLPFEGMKHNALFDSLHDMRCLLEAKRLHAEGLL